MFLSFLSKIFPNPTLFLFIGAMSALGLCMYQTWQLDKAERQLEAAQQIIQQYQQAQALTESANSKLTEHKEATRNEIARQQKITQEALENHKDWADTYLPESVLRLFNAETTAPGDVPAADGASR